MKDRKLRGFTLIEVIIALVCISLLAVMIVSFGGDFVSRSTNPVSSLSRASDLQAGIDNVTRGYYNLALPITHTTLDTFKTNLQSDPGTYIGVTGVNIDTTRTKFIKFDGTSCANGSNCENDNSDADSYLKVTLENADGQSVSTIFTAR